MAGRAWFVGRVGKGDSGRTHDGADYGGCHPPRRGTGKAGRAALRHISVAFVHNLISTAGVNDMRPLRARQPLGGRTPRWRKALVVGCALLLVGLAMAAPPAAPSRADEAGAAHASPWASAAAEARILADRILQRESDDLLLDGKRQRALGHEIKQALSLIRRAYPAMADISVREEYSRATIVLGVEGALRDAVFAAWDEESAGVPQPTGHAAFDALNAGLGLRAVQPFPAFDSVVLRLDERANIAAAPPVYLSLPGIAYAEPDAMLGDGSDIDAMKAEGRWHVVFRRAWGDCPSGCIDEELSFFTVADGEAARIEPAQARGMDAFAALVAGRGWR